MCAILKAKAMTEAIHCRKASHLMASNPLSEDNPRRPRSVGKLVGQEMVILDENGVQQKANVNPDLGGGGRRDSDEMVILVAVVVRYCYCWR
ncbi:oxalate-- ligase [Olea europaea subsp. europaea]|uniref:Oxalate-- ligase n=1 Tax=Olea europaea subsp. europaea TaxID=158383 RepID=A0A8S0VDM9_OLEEU|nr:oxalate-- ligase [Olea europaea subsp. europaea]